MRIASRDLQVVTVGLVSAVLLAGCSGNSSKPTVLPPLTTSATPAAASTPAPAPTTTPAPATTAGSASLVPTLTAPSSAAPTPRASKTSTTHISKSAVQDFIQSYYDSANQSLSDSKGFASWHAKFEPSCTVCVSDYSAISEERSAGSTYVGGQYKILSIKVTDVATNGAVAEIKYDLPAVKVYSKSGKLLESGPEVRGRRAKIDVSITGAQIRITYITNQAS